MRYYRVCPFCKHHMDPKVNYGFKIWVCHRCSIHLDRGLKAFIQRIRNRGY